MKFHLTNVRLDDLGTVDLESLEDLTKLYEEKGHPLILSKHTIWNETKDKTPVYELEIYDGYRE